MTPLSHIIDTDAVYQAALKQIEADADKSPSMSQRFIAGWEGSPLVWPTALPIDGVAVAPRPFAWTRQAPGR